MGVDASIGASLGFLLVMMAADAITTIIGLENGRKEINPIMRMVFRYLSPSIAVILTKALFLAIALAAAYFHPTLETAGAIALVGAAHLTAALWNVRQL